jgi:hypothetical protein
VCSYSPLVITSEKIFNFALDCAVRKVKANQEVLRLHRTHQLLASADGANLLVGKIHVL